MPQLKPNGHRLNGKGSGWITKTRRLAIYLRDGFLCAYCGTDLHSAPPRHVTLDHLTPQCQGGTHESSNLVTACLACNSRRQHQSWFTYAPEGSRLRIARLRRRVPNLPLARAILSGAIPRAEAILENR
jgi:5-methylcytosine-specific restriction endonuclease McrA